MRLSTVAAASLAAVAVCALSTPAKAQFSGYYAPGNWTFSNVNANGSVNTSGAPSFIVLTGGNNNSGNAGTTSFTISSAGTGTVSFNWLYNTSDLNPSYDPFIFKVNGVQMTTTNGGGPNTQSGFYSTGIAAGQSLSFQIYTTDNKFGTANVKISNFSAPSISAPGVPEPGEYAVMGMAGLTLCGLIVRARRRKAA